jgi:hypothetical protein
VPPVGFLVAVVVICVLVAVINGVTRRVRRRQRDTTPTAEEWDGRVVAVVLTARHIKSEYSSGQKARMVARPSEGSAAASGEVVIWTGEPEGLPDRVAAQSFQGIYLWQAGPLRSGDGAITDFDLPTRQERRAARRAMYRGGYRMNLPDPVPVHVTRDVKGRYWWDITG